MKGFRRWSARSPVLPFVVFSLIFYVVFTDCIQDGFAGFDLWSLGAISILFVMWCMNTLVIWLKDD